MPTVKVAIAMTVPTIPQISRVSRLGELRVHAGDVGRQTGVEVCDLGPHLGEAGPELVGRDVVAVLEGRRGSPWR
ncbi:MAG: hypothetical protein OXQ28_07060 [Acidobacteriota bacterium]|nr:hypothetical protein [Acidobacteriota bacterium]